MASEMKDSGIEWIGEIPREWEVAQLKRFINVNNGREIETEVQDTNGAIPVYGSGGVFKYTNIPLFDGETVMFGRKGTLGKPIYANEKLWTVDTMYFLTFSDDIFAKFNYYQLVSFDWNPHITQTALPSVVGSEIVSCHFAFPPFSEQQSIAVFLDTQCAHIDSVIEKTRAAIEEYKRLKQSVITQAVTKGIRPNREMKDSGIEWIGEIPKEWRAILIIGLLDYSHPYPLGDGDHGLIKTESYQQTGIPYIRVQNLSWGQDLILDNLVYISEKDNNRIINSTLKPNDILFAKTGATIGKTGIVPNSIPVANTTSHIGKLTLSNTVNSKYVFYSLSSHVGYRQFWERACLKATRPELTIDEIRSIKVILPDSFTEQSEIVAYLDEKTTAIDSLIQKKEQLISELEAYKKSLIYEYVTGKKEVPVHAH